MIDNKVAMLKEIEVEKDERRNNEAAAGVLMATAIRQTWSSLSSKYIYHPYDHQSPRSWQTSYFPDGWGELQQMDRKYIIVASGNKASSHQILVFWQKQPT